MDILSGHNMKEERILYPGTDNVLSKDERSEVVRRGQAL